MAVKVARGSDKIDTLVRDLNHLGFSDYEARTYLALLKNYPATAYEISRNAQLPRSNTYSALESLTRKKAVQPIGLSPARFAPIAPEQMLRQIADETSQRCKKVTDQLSRISSGEGTDFVWTIEGEQKVHAKITEMIERATRHVWIKAHEDILEAHADELRAAAARGVSIVIILFGEHPGRYDFAGNVRTYLHEGNGVRIGNADNLFTITTDFDLALTASFEGQDMAAYTSSSPVVRMAETLIRHDIYMAEIFERFGTEIEAEFGPFLFSLRQSYFSPEQLVKFTKTMDRFHPNFMQSKRREKKRRAAASK